MRVILLVVAVMVAGAAHGGRGAGREVDLVEVREVAPDMRVDLSYFHRENAFRRKFYARQSALLRKPVALRLARVQRRLRARGLGLKVWDAYRPASVHRKMWALRPGTRYLSNPKRGSKHSRGAAVDVTLVTRAGRELAMPTRHDEFGPRAHRGAVRGVSREARKNSGLLEAAMRAEGFLANRYEWWHFSAPDWRRYPLLETAGPTSQGPPGS